MFKRAHHLPRSVRAGVLAVLAVLAGTAMPAGATAATPAPASAGCIPHATTQAFAQFGDPRHYYLAPGGAFEDAVTWTSSGAVALAAENEPWYLAGKRDTTSARLGSGATITSPKLCVTRDHPFLRFLARSAGSGQLDVTVRVYGAGGAVTDSSSGSVSPSDHAGWAPSALIALKTDSLAAGETAYVDVSFRSQGEWLVDDVFIDPYRG